MSRIVLAFAAALCGAAPAALVAQTGPARPNDEIQQRIEGSRRGNAKGDWEREQEAREFRDGAIALPAPPGGGLIEFFVTAASSFRFFVDPQSLSVGSDGVVRYTLVARSPSGTDTVSYEGMRCSNETYRVYAFANDGAWSRSQAGDDWRPIEAKTVSWHSILRSRYFCPQRYSIQTAAEGIDALRRGVHPLVRNDGIGGGR